VVDPVRNLPRALIGGLTIVVVLYLITQTAYVVCLGPEKVAGSLQLAADVGLRALGPAGERLMAALIALSTFGTVLGMMLTCPRMYYAMAHDGVFLPAAGRVHPRWGTPHVAVVLQALWSLVLLSWGTFGKLLSYVMFATWLFYAMTAASLFILRARGAGKPGPFATPGYPMTVWAFLLASLILMGNCFSTSPRESMMGVGMLIAGLPLFVLFRPRATRILGADPGRD
jgi:APA family basic amino acid/polyamine antiporter